MAIPAALKTFNGQLFKVNAAIETALTPAHKLETDIAKKRGAKNGR